jgi:SPP1 family phage portal protein
VWIKDVIDKIRKGVKAGMIAVKESNALTDARVVRLISEFEASPEREWMMTGERYYQVDNDILSRKITHKDSRGNVIEESYKANNKLAHGKYKNQVDEKIAYLLSKPVTFKADTSDNDSRYIERLKDLLGKNFQYQLSLLGYEASNKGIAWLHVYIDRNGQLKTLVIPSEQCIPLWKDRTHTELDTLIRVYRTSVWEYDQRKTVTNVEVWTADSVTYYRLQGQMLILDADKMTDNGGPVAHYKAGNLCTCKKCRHDDCRRSGSTVCRNGKEIRKDDELCQYRTLNRHFGRGLSSITFTAYQQQMLYA